VLDAFGVQVPLPVNVVTAGAIGMLPDTAGSVSVVLPATAGAASVTEPEVSPATTIELIA
jgi:hypothetical protein